MQISSNTVSGYFGENWASNAAVFQMPQFIQKMLQYYPGESLMLTYQRMAGNIISVSNPTLNALYDGAMERTILTGADIAAGAIGAQAALTLDASAYDSNNAVYLSEDYTVIVPPQYLTISGAVPLNSQLFQVLYGQTTGSASAKTLSFVIKPLNALVKINATIPAGTQLAVGPTNYSRGSGQPQGKIDYQYESTFTTAIVKTTLSIEGGIPAIKLWRDTFANGGKNTVLRGMEKMNFYHDSQIEKQIWLGDVNTNSITTTNTPNSAARTVLGTKGVLRHMENESMTFAYDGDNFQFTNIEAIKGLLESQLVTERDVNVFCGPDFMRRYERATINWVAQNSHGTDLTSKLQQLNYPIRVAYMNGVNFAFTEMSSWSNPTTYGAPGNPYRDMALIFPNTQSSAKLNGKDSKPVMLDNLTIAYLNYGGEDRTRILKKVDGMTGLELDGVNQFDEWNTYMLSELMVVFLHPNQCILAYNSATSSLQNQ
jgi:hypothetical protein